MKIRKLRNGYRLNATNGEFEALKVLLGPALAAVNRKKVEISGPGRRALNSPRFASIEALLHVDPAPDKPEAEEAEED